MLIVRTAATFVIAVITGLIATRGWTDEQSKLNVAPDGFHLLFNGKDLAGWKGLVGRPHDRAAMTEEQLAEAQVAADQKMREHWTVEDGVIVFDGRGDSLCTMKDYADFEMFVDWKIKEKGDSGIYVRGLPQIQIWDPANTKIGSGGLYNNKNNPSQPLVNADNPVGEWNTFYIKMVGSQVTVRLNGQLVVDNVVLENLWEPEKPVYSSEQIELQNHGNTLWFRNIYLRELTTSDQLAKIEASLPQVARAKPEEPRKVFIFTGATGYQHSSIPHGAHAIQLMGQKTGAYEATISDDLSWFAPQRLQQFDAVVLCNTTGNWIQPSADVVKKLSEGGQLDAESAEQLLRQSVLNFVKGGKGLMGFHSASDANYHWPEYGQLIGGYFNHHPWHEEVGIRVELPSHPLSQAFGGQDFSVVDEIYQFRDPYSREHLQVLLSLDTAKANMKKDSIQRTDGDFAVAWIRHEGKGRVFYSSLGHREEIFWNPAVMQFYLDGLQFALGDLKVER